MRRMSGPTMLGLALVCAVALGSCGDDGGSSDGSGQTDAPAMEHVHGLDVDPRNGTLFIATHTGLLTAARDETRARRFGYSRQDIMGFSVVGPGRFIGSGHPAPDQDLPPNLGLIRSDDGGRSWDSVSLMGDADFHVLESAGDRIYGFDGTQGRVMVSRDRGASWAEHAPPAAMFALAIDPGDATHAVTATERGLFASADEGRTWRPLRNDLTGLLAWPEGKRLYLVDGPGEVRRSTDGGREWHAAGSIDGQPAAFTAEGRDLYVALADGTVKRSGDGGRTWRARATP